MMKRNTVAGFSLIELMVAVLVVGILTAIAVPTYQSSVRKSRRTEARSAMVDLQAREERYFSTNPSQGYTTAASALGYAASGASTDMGTAQPVGTSGYYNVQIAAGSSGSLAPSASAAGTYLITVTPVSSGAQYKDTPCRSFTLDQNGVQGASDSSGASTATVISNCWR